MEVGTTDLMVTCTLPSAAENCRKVAKVFRAGKSFAGGSAAPASGRDFASAVRPNLRAKWVTETTAEEDHGTERKVEATVTTIKTRSKRKPLIQRNGGYFVFDRNLLGDTFSVPDIFQVFRQKPLVRCRHFVYFGLCVARPSTAVRILCSST
jgi:hypothetical protein